MSSQSSDLLQTTMNNFFDAVMKEESTKVAQLIAENHQSPEMSIKQNINYKRPEDGMTALHFAAMAESDELIRLLMVNDADPKITADDGSTPAHIAAKYGNLKNLKSLLEKDNELIYSIDADGNTPLHLASYHGRKEVVEYLVTIMSDINQKDKQGCTAFYEASLNGKDECLKLLSPNSNIFTRNQDNSSVLDAAAFEKDNETKSRKKCIEFLLDKYLGICGDIASDGIEFVDFTNKVLIGLKISGTPIEDCVDFYSQNYCKNTTLADAIYTKDQLAKALSSGKIKKDQLPLMQHACEQQKIAIQNIPNYQDTPEFNERIQELEDLSSFLEQLRTQPTNVISSLIHLVWDKTKNKPPIADTTHTLDTSEPGSKTPPPSSKNL